MARSFWTSSTMNFWLICKSLALPSHQQRNSAVAYSFAFVSSVIGALSKISIFLSSSFTRRIGRDSLLCIAHLRMMEINHEPNVSFALLRCEVRVAGVSRSDDDNLFDSIDRSLIFIDSTCLNINLSSERTGIGYGARIQKRNIACPFSYAGSRAGRSFVHRNITASIRDDFDKKTNASKMLFLATDFDE